MGLTRRDPIAHLMAAGSYGAALGSLSALGLLPTAATASTFQPLGLPTTSGNGKRVLVVGAGISGLVAASMNLAKPVLRCACWKPASESAGAPGRCATATRYCTMTAAASRCVSTTATTSMQDPHGCPATT